MSSGGSGVSNSAVRPLVLLVADDLTGACDSGLAFVKAGCSVCVQLDAAEHTAPASADVVAISAETRNLRPGDAKARLETLEQLRGFTGPILFHKVDSAGRGNPGEEMLAIAAIGGCAAIVYAPAFPAAGRPVRGGVLNVSDFSGQDTQIDLCTLIPPGARQRVQIVETGSEEKLRQQMLAARGAGKDIWLCDAGAREDLERIAAAAASLNLRLLWTGSAGLAEAVAGLRAVVQKASGAPTPPRPGQGRTLVVSGTDHPVTETQIGRLALQATVLSPDGIGLSQDFQCGVAKIDWAAASSESLREYWRRLHQGDRPRVNALVLTGGDTAAFVLDALGATSLRLRGEVEPGIPWSIAGGGLVDECIVITKSGGFGTEQSLVNIAGFCRRMQE